MSETTDRDPDDAGRTVSPFGPPTEVPTRMLVLGMLRSDGLVEAKELYPVAEACGQTVEQVRSCLRRLVGEGLFTREGEGRDARFHATASCLRQLGEDLERSRLAFGQDAAGRGWDRQWHLIAFAIPEAKRASRDAFRDQLIQLGGAAVQNGLYVSPHPWEKAARDHADRLGVLSHTTLATTDDLEVGGVTDPRRIAAALWPLEELGGAVPGLRRRVPPRPRRARAATPRQEPHHRGGVPAGQPVVRPPLPGVLRRRPAAAAGAAPPSVARP